MSKRDELAGRMVSAAMPILPGDWEVMQKLSWQDADCYLRERDSKMVKIGFDAAIEEVLKVATEYFEEGWADSEDQAAFLKEIKSLREG